MSTAGPHTFRVITHIDLDCFYAQVEQKRLGIPRDTPCAVQQWDGLIAVNYAARAAGVTRHMRVAAAKQQCPALVLVHVQTIGGVGASDGAEGSAAAQQRTTTKACLQRYRQASGHILRLLTQQCPGAAIEKASIDEVYVDLTPVVRQALQQLARSDPLAPGGAGSDPSPSEAASRSSGGSGGARSTAPCMRSLPASFEELLRQAGEATVVEGGPLAEDVDFDRHLAVGAWIVLQLRRAVRDDLGFTCSAGVAVNKLLSKVASARHKPNKQAVVLPRAVSALLRDLPLGKIRGLGGKLGAQLTALGVSTAGEACALSWGALAAALGERAKWAADVVRGLDEEPVTPQVLVKSVNSCKSFPATSRMDQAAYWMRVLAAELSDRLEEQAADHQRRARTLVLSYRGGSAATAGGGAAAGASVDRSVRTALPTAGAHEGAADVICATGMALMHRVRADAFPLWRLALGATDFDDAPVPGACSIARFLVPQSGQQQQQQQPFPLLYQHPGHHQQPRGHASEAAKSAPPPPPRCSGSHGEAAGRTTAGPAAADYLSAGPRQRAAEQQPRLSTGGAAPAASAAPASGETHEEVDIDSVDVGEQQRIMRAIQAQQRPVCTGKSTKPAAKKQRLISSWVTQ